jgi:hypothetical protein
MREREDSSPVIRQCVYNIIMESNKKNSYSFLEKFRGRTNKIDKNGINNALNPQIDEVSN